MSFRKVGGIWFVKIGRVGFNFYVSKRAGTKSARKRILHLLHVNNYMLKPLDDLGV